MRVPAFCGTAVLAACTLHAGQAPTPDLRDAVNAYIDRFVETATNIVAEEQITQEADGPRAKRTIRSDFVVVRLPGPQLYVFRDAFEVDGRRVRDLETERLPKLFDQPTTAALTQAQALSNATMRHYLRDIGTVNNPLLVISLLQRTNRHRFLLSVAGKDSSLGPTVRRIGFKEVVTPTVLRWGDRANHQDRAEAGRTGHQVAEHRRLAAADGRHRHVRHRRGDRDRRRAGDARQVPDGQRRGQGSDDLPPISQARATIARPRPSR
jgi:hypothetical protein